jgi:FkbM family methyltransferase
MGFFWKKARLLLFLTWRVRRHGGSQWLRGLRDRKMAYLAMDLAKILPDEARTIVDVGAHIGLVADALDFLYSPNRLWAVEPNPALKTRLEARFRDRPNVILVDCCMGETGGEAVFNAYDFDAASSLFACKPGHLASLGLSEQSVAVKVPVRTLRESLPSDLKVLDLLKLDCQGAELSVLKGAGERIRDIRWVFCEVSIDPIYQGAPLWDELHAFLRSSGFELRSLSGLSGTGASIQWADALYANTKLAAQQATSA